jgi:hypothetical protein
VTPLEAAIVRDFNEGPIDLVALTKAMLIAGGIPPSTIPESTIRHFLSKGWSPDRIVRELWGICPECDAHLGGVES